MPILKKSRLLMAATGLSVLLSACSMPLFSIEELMQAPKLSESQNAVYDALSRSIGTDNFVLKYPRSGTYRSAFVFYDIDEDNTEEAIVFYQLDASVSSGTRINILDNRGGHWESVYDVSGEEDSEVDYIQFESIESADYKNILIGWSISTALSPTTQMSIYRYEDTADGVSLANASSDMNRMEYERSIIRDIDADGLTDVVLLSRRRTNSSYRLQLISSVDGIIDQTDSISFGENVNGVLNLIFGRLADWQQALFVDVALSNSYFATEILTVKDKCFVPLINVADVNLDDPDLFVERNAEAEEDVENLEDPAPPEDVPEGIEEKDPLLDNFRATLRAQEILSADFDGDSVIEVPSTRPMPGYERDEEENEIRDEDMKYLTLLSVYRDGEMVPLMNGYVNLRAGYFLRFPDRWKDVVTVYAENDLTLCRFIKYQSDLNDLSIELLRIRRTTKNDFQDRFETNPILLDSGQNGTVQFYGVIPPAGEEELAINEAELRTLFFPF